MYCVWSEKDDKSCSTFYYECGMVAHMEKPILWHALYFPIPCSLSSFEPRQARWRGNVPFAPIFLYNKMDMAKNVGRFF